MKSQFNRQYETLTRVRAFGEKHSDLFPPESFAGKTFAAIADSISVLKDGAASQSARIGQAREGVASKAEAREALREWLSDISRTARAIAEENPAIIEKFRMRYNLTDKELIDDARGFLHNAAPLAEVFAAHELPPLPEFEAAIARFDNAVESHADLVREQVSATAAIGAAMEHAMGALHRLDGIVPNKVKGNAAAFREWEVARRIRTVRSSNEPEPSPAPTPSDSTAAAVAA